jgi:hypothetical protein
METLVKRTKGIDPLVSAAHKKVELNTQPAIDTHTWIDYND